MSVPSEEELLEKLKKRPNLEPRAEFAHSLEEMLAYRARKLNARKHIRRLVAGCAVCAVAIVSLGLTVLPGNYLFTSTLANLQTKLSPLVPDTGEQLFNGKLNRQAQQTLDSLIQIMPELKHMEKTVQLSPKDHESMYLVRFRPVGEKNLYAWIDIHAGTGMLDSLMLAHEEHPNTPGPPSVTVTKEAAGAIIRALIGKEFEQYQGEADETPMDSWRNIQFNRYVNGIPVAGDSYSLAVNGEGKVTDVQAGKNVRKNLDLRLFPAPSETAGTAIAEQSLSRLLRLSYVNGKKGLTLQYEPAFSGYVNAKTGEPVAGDPARPTYTPVSVSPGGKQPLARTMEEAAKVAASEFGLDLKGQGFVPSDMPKEMLADHEVEYKTADNSVTISAISGRVVHFSRFQAKDPASAKAALSPEQALQKAVQFMQNYLAPDVQEMFYTVRNDLNGIPQLEFSFYHSHEGIPVLGSRCTVRVDLSDGSIVYYRDELLAKPDQFPDKATAIPAEAAAANLLKQYPPKLRYVYPEQDGKPASTPVLAYYVQNVAIDALTGVPR